MVGGAYFGVYGSRHMQHETTQRLQIVTRSMAFIYVIHNGKRGGGEGVCSLQGAVIILYSVAEILAIFFLSCGRGTANRCFVMVAASGAISLHVSCHNQTPPLMPSPL